VADRPAQPARDAGSGQGGPSHGGPNGGGPDWRERNLPFLGDLLLSDSVFPDTLERVAQLAAAVMPTGVFADITMVSDGRVVAKGASDPRAQELDALQDASGDGPCLDALRHGNLNRVDSTRTDTRWPGYMRAAVDIGVLSSVALPLQVRGAVNGVLNLSSTSEHAFAGGGEETGLRLADQAAVALENARLYSEAVARAAQLAEALESRDVIGQAKGILIAGHRCTADRAFEILVERSQHENRKLRVVAEDIVREAQIPR
jgi:GAF domain-containing protein